MTMARKRILLIGLGRWGVNHLRILKSMPVELFASDVDERRINSVGVSGDHWRTNPRTLLSQINAAVLVAPAPAHFATCRELLEMGKDLFVEKPISLLSAEAKKLTKLAERAGLILQVGYIFRFDPASLWLRDVIAQGRFGRIKMLRAKFTGLKRPRLDTGVTFADSIHFIDLFNFFLGGTPRRIHAVVDDFLRRGMDDESLIVMEYDRGDGSAIRATVEAGYHAPGKVREVVIIGDEASAVCDYNVAQYKIKIFENRHIADGSSIKASEGAVNQLEFLYEEPLRGKLADFIESIETHSRPMLVR